MDKYKSKRLFRGIIYFILGFVFFNLSGTLFAGTPTPILERPIPETMQEEALERISQGGEAMGWGLLLICFSFLLIPLQRYQAKNRERRPVNLTTDDYALYLRCFNDDRLTARYPGREVLSEEESLMRVVEKIGKPVAIGCPGDKTPPLGAYRIYVEDNEWQAKVTELVEGAKLVILRIGSTEGLTWEVLHCLNNIRDLTRLVFVVPYCKGVNLLSLGNLAANMQVYRGDLIQSTVHYNKPAKGTIASFLYFAQTTDGAYELRQSDVPKRRPLWFLTPYQYLVEKAWKPILKQFGKLNLWRYCAKRAFLYLGWGLVAVASLIGGNVARQNESYGPQEFLKFYTDEFENYPIFVEATRYLNYDGKFIYIRNLTGCGLLRLPDEDLVYYFDVWAPTFASMPVSKINNDIAVINHMMINYSQEEVLKWLKIHKKAALLELEYLQNNSDVEEEVFPEDSPEEIAEAKRLLQSLLTPQQKEKCKQLQQSALKLEINEGEELTPEQCEKISRAVIDIRTWINRIPDVRAKAILIRQYLLGKPFFIDEP